MLIRREQYLGMWAEDQYHGPGILIAENQFFFSGMFANGERSVSRLSSILCSNLISSVELKLMQ